MISPRPSRESQGITRIVLASNPAYFPGLSLTVASALAFLDRHTEPRITIFHEALSSGYQDRLAEIVHRIRPATPLEWIDIHQHPEELPPAPGLHPLAYARMLAPYYVPEDQFIYLDSDLLVLRDISEMPRCLEADKIAAAALDDKGRLGDDCPWLDPQTMHPDDPYMNTGVMLMDRKKWIEAEITSKAFQIARHEFAKCRTYDQTVLNYLLHKKISFLDKTWNWHNSQFGKAPAQDPLIVHYIMPNKPWQAPRPYGASALWVKTFRLLCHPDLTFRTRLNSRTFQERLQQTLISLAASAVIQPVLKNLRPATAQRMRWLASINHSDASPANRQKVRICHERLVATIPETPARD